MGETSTSKRGGSWESVNPVPLQGKTRNADREREGPRKHAERVRGSAENPSGLKQPVSIGLLAGTPKPPQAQSFTRQTPCARVWAPKLPGPKLLVVTRTGHPQKLR